MAPHNLVFFAVFTGVSMISTVVVVGFTAPPATHASSCSSFASISTTLRYVAETNYQDEQYFRSRPNDVKIRPEEMKVVDVPMEGKTQTVYIPMHEMEDAIRAAQNKHEADCANLQNTIDEQRQELQRLKERNRNSRLEDRMKYNHLADETPYNWGENHDEKMKRATDRVQFLTIENERLQEELNEERSRFDFEKGQLERKLEQARVETVEAERVLSLERSYFETATKLLEAGLARESKRAIDLEQQLLEANEEEYHRTYSHHQFYEDASPFETWDGSGAYEQQQGHHTHYPQDFVFHEDVVEEDIDAFEPRVRPQNYDVHGQSHFDESFHVYEPEPFNVNRDYEAGQHYRSRPKVTTTVMGASSIRDNLGINEIRDPMYR